MALDNAQFISELSIIDPPGTDPLSQGDDQIRTIKRATFQSFPLIAAAVNLTDVQLNLAAIKNEANVFTVANQQFLNSQTLTKSGDGENAGFNFAQFGGEIRWRLFQSTAANGEDFIIARNDVLGVFIDQPMRIKASSGVVDFAHAPTVGGAALWIAGEIREFVAAVTPGTNWFKADGTNGTVNLQGRWRVMESAFLTLGTAINASLTSVTTATGLTGSTAISSAQMPSHRHRVRSGSQTGITDTVLSHPSTQTVIGANRGNLASAFIDTNSGGQAFVENTGSGSGHTHADGGNAMVLGQPGFSDTVQPLSYVTTLYQYVP